VAKTVNGGWFFIDILAWIRPQRVGGM